MSECALNLRVLLLLLYWPVQFSWAAPSSSTNYLFLLSRHRHKEQVSSQLNQQTLFIFGSQLKVYSAVVPPCSKSDYLFAKTHDDKLQASYKTHTDILQVSKGKCENAYHMTLSMSVHIVRVDTEEWMMYQCLTLIGLFSSWLQLTLSRLIQSEQLIWECMELVTYGLNNHWHRTCLPQGSI